MEINSWLKVDKTVKSLEVHLQQKYLFLVDKTD
jgi:hypothetical protein